MNFYIWRDNVVGSLLGLSDTSYQRLAWTGAIESSDGSPEEMLATLMDDWAFESFMPDNREQFNDFQLERTDSLLVAIRQYLKNEPAFAGDTEHVLANGSWRDVVISARDLYLALCPSS